MQNTCTFLQFCLHKFRVSEGFLCTRGFFITFNWHSVHSELLQAVANCWYQFNSMNWCGPQKQPRVRQQPLKDHHKQFLLSSSLTDLLFPHGPLFQQFATPRGIYQVMIKITQSWANRLWKVLCSKDNHGAKSPFLHLSSQQFGCKDTRGDHAKAKAEPQSCSLCMQKFPPAPHQGLQRCWPF